MLVRIASTNLLNSVNFSTRVKDSYCLVLKRDYDDSFLEVPIFSDLSRSLTKPTKWYVRPAKTRVSLGIHPVWSESSLSTWRNIRFFATHWVHIDDSDQTGRMQVILLVLSCSSSFIVYFRLAILSNFPETTSPAEYKILLPEIRWAQ